MVSVVHERSLVFVARCLRSYSAFFLYIYVTNSAVYLTNNSFYRVRPLSDGSNPWSTSLVKSQKSVPLAALFAEQGEPKLSSGDIKFV